MTLFATIFTASTLTTQLNNYSNWISPAQNTTSWLCRTERRVLLPFESFHVDTCARCYNYLPKWAFRNVDLKFRYNSNQGTLEDPVTNNTFPIDPENTSHPILETFSSQVFALKWISCCRAAVACCQKMTTDPASANGGKSFCPRTWDGWQCWPDTPSGETAMTSCEEHVYFSSKPPSCTRYATKSCLSNGTWFVRDENKVEWTDYSGCGRVQVIRHSQYFQMTTHAISILFLLPAIIIFATYKQLQVNRITMHKNLFSSLLFNGIFVIFFKSSVMMDELRNIGDRMTLLSGNGPGCKFLFILTKYFRMTNYMWMFCEGFYLHRLIVAAFAEQRNPLLFYLIGWVFPVATVAVYALLREMFANEQCWVIPADPYEWILNGPNLLSLMMNFAFLCHIIQVLLTKLRATHAREPSQYRKAVRATLVLVPLFGLDFVLVMYRPQSGECHALDAYQFFSYAVDGLQGFVVALIFCYFNGEVQSLVWSSIQKCRLQSRKPIPDWQGNRESRRLNTRSR